MNSRFLGVLIVVVTWLNCMQCCQKPPYKPLLLVPSGHRRLHSDASAKVVTRSIVPRVQESSKSHEDFRQKQKQSCDVYSEQQAILAALGVAGCCGLALTSYVITYHYYG